MGMKFKVLSKDNCEQVRTWRNEALETLRTPFPLTKEQQEKFYNDIVCNRNASARYWGIWESAECNVKYNTCQAMSETDCFDMEISGTDKFIGMCGLENIEWENSRAEISLIINPKYRGKGYGIEAVDRLLHKGFNETGLRQIYGEVYDCNPAKEFWQNIIKKYNGYQVKHKCIKFWNGEYWNSLYFSFEWKDYLNLKKKGDKGCESDNT